MAPVNVSQACIPIPAGYACVVGSGTAQDQASHGWIFVAGINFLSPFPPYTKAQQHQGREEGH